MPILVALLNCFGSFGHRDQKRVVAIFLGRLFDALDKVDDLRAVAAVLLLDQFDCLGVDFDEVRDGADRPRST